MRTRIVITLLAAAVVACNDDDNPANERFTASMAASKEVNNDGTPKNLTSTATGLATFTVVGDRVDFVLTGNNINNVIAAHIHAPASATQNASVLVPLYSAAPPGTGPYTNSEIVHGSFTAAQISNANISMDSLLVLMRNGNAYVNVHTTANTAGEMRGQLGHTGVSAASTENGGY
jgi:hypothetical protein